jgi:predicted alpha/beta-hydrolase family hydrolase
MESVTTHLFHRDIATFRYQFPYMEAGRRSPDTPSVLASTVRAAVTAAHDTAPDLPIVAGGKSLGGRISSHVVASDAPAGIRGLIFLGYPLHAPKKPNVTRSEHLSTIRVPMLFLQGTRDDLADLRLFEPIINQLGPLATLHKVRGGDHSFKVLKRSGRTEHEVMQELAGAIRTWTRRALS